jgi:hypothetical protein
MARPTVAGWRRSCRGCKWYCSKHLRLARLILPLVQEMRYVEIHEADMVAGAG